MEPDLRVAFAGDRQIAVDVLDHLIAQGVRPVALLLPEPAKASHSQELVLRCEGLAPQLVFRGTGFRKPAGIDVLRRLNLDYLISVHFPYLVPPEVLSLPAHGCVNLHPAFLPYNRGWHTPTWAILEGTPAGATLHFMDAGVDSGDVIHQREVVVRPDDTADSLYQRLLAAEVEVFREAWPLLAGGRPPRLPQPVGSGTTHTRRDLFSPAVQALRLDDRQRVGDVLRQLRALTTRSWGEASYFDEGGRRYRVRVEIVDESALG